MLVFWYVELSLIALLSLLYAIHTAESTNLGNHVGTLSWIFVFVVVWMIASWRIWLGPLFKPFPIILLSAIAFNGGQILLESVGLNENGLLPNRGFSTELLERTVWYITLGLLVFHAGGAISAISRRRHALEKSPSQPEQLLKAMSVTGFMLLVVGLPAWVFLNIQRLIIAQQQGYSALYGSDTSIQAEGLLSILSGFVITGVFLFAMGNRHSKWVVAGSTIIMLSMTIVLFAQGHRATAAWPLVAYLWLVHEGIRKLPGMLLGAVGGAMLLVIFPLLRVIRSGPGSFSLSELPASYASLGNPAVEILREMGFSGSIVGHTLDLVPTTRDFDYGLSYLNAILFTVPNVFGPDGRSDGQYHTLSGWLIWNWDPSIAEVGGSIGFSFIAEAYLNFGWWLGLFALFLIGYGICAFFSWMARSYWYLGMAASGVMLSYFSHFARGESILVVRPAVWYVLIPVVIVVILYTVLRSQRSRLSLPTDSEPPEAGAKAEYYPGMEGTEVQKL